MASPLITGLSDRPESDRRAYVAGRHVGGAPGGNRTPDAGLRTASLYPLSYGGGASEHPIIGPCPDRRALILYERHGCHLCEHARVLLDDMLGPDRYLRVDIETDDDLVLRYGFRIPVIALDGVGPPRGADRRP